MLRISRFYSQKIISHEIKALFCLYFHHIVVKLPQLKYITYTTPMPNLNELLSVYQENQEVSVHIDLLKEVLLKPQLSTLGKELIKENVAQNVVIESFLACFCFQPETNPQRYYHTAAFPNEIKFRVNINHSQLNLFLSHLQSPTEETRKFMIALAAAFNAHLSIQHLLSNDATVDVKILAFLRRVQSNDELPLLPVEKSLINQGVKEVAYFLKSGETKNTSSYSGNQSKLVTFHANSRFRAMTRRSKENRRQSLDVIWQNPIALLFSVLKNEKNRKISDDGENTSVEFNLNKLYDQISSYIIPGQFVPLYIADRIKKVQELSGGTLEVKTLFDPCAGWGDRLAGTLVSGVNYHGIDPSDHSEQIHSQLIPFFQSQEMQSIIDLEDESEEDNSTKRSSTAKKKKQAPATAAGLLQIKTNLAQSRATFYKGKMQDYVDNNTIPPADLSLTCPPYSKSQENYNNLDPNLNQDNFEATFLIPLLHCMNNHLRAGGFGVLVVATDMYRMVYDVLHNALNYGLKLQFIKDGRFFPSVAGTSADVCFMWRRTTDFSMMQEPRLKHHAQWYGSTQVQRTKDIILKKQAGAEQNKQLSGQKRHSPPAAGTSTPRKQLPFFNSLAEEADIDPSGEASTSLVRRSTRR